MVLRSGLLPRLLDHDPVAVELGVVHVGDSVLGVVVVFVQLEVSILVDMVRL